MKQKILIGLSAGALLLMVILTIAPNIDSRSMNTNQFNVAGNRLSIRDGVRLTNQQSGTIKDDAGVTRIILASGAASGFNDGSGASRIEADVGGSVKLKDATANSALEITSIGDAVFSHTAFLDTLLSPDLANTTGFYLSDVTYPGEILFYNNGIPTVSLSRNQSIFNAAVATFGGNIIGNGSGLTNLVHSATVSAGAGATVTPTKNADGSTNYAVALSGGGSSAIAASYGLAVNTNGTVYTPWNFAFNPTKLVVVFIGDSYTYSPGADWVGLFTNAPPFSNNIQVINNAISGASLVAQSNTLSTNAVWDTVNAMTKNSATQALFIVQAGLHDLVDNSGSLSLSDLTNTLAGIAGHVHGSNWLMEGLTIVQECGHQFPNQYARRYHQYNTYLRWYAPLDFLGDPASKLPNMCDTNLSTDGVHPTYPLGYTVYASEVYYGLTVTPKPLNLYPGGPLAHNQVWEQDGTNWVLWNEGLPTTGVATNAQVLAWSDGAGLFSVSNLAALNVPGSGTNLSVDANGRLIKSTIGGGSSDTPWTTTHNGGGFSLTNLYQLDQTLNSNNVAGSAGVWASSASCASNIVQWYGPGHYLWEGTFSGVTNVIVYTNTWLLNNSGNVSVVAKISCQSSGNAAWRANYFNQISFYGNAGGTPTIGTQALTVNDRGGAFASLVWASGAGNFTLKIDSGNTNLCYYTVSLDIVRSGTNVVIFDP